MKKMLYAGAILMIGASIYGFVDYKRTSQKKEFKALYTEEKKETKKTPVALDQPADKSGDLVRMDKQAKKEVKGNKEMKEEVKKSSTRKFRLSEFSRGRIPDDEEVILEKEDTKTRVADSITKK